MSDKDIAQLKAELAASIRTVKSLKSLIKSDNSIKRFVQAIKSEENLDSIISFCVLFSLFMTFFCTAVFFSFGFRTDKLYVDYDRHGNSRVYMMYDYGSDKGLSRCTGYENCKEYMETVRETLGLQCQ